MTIHELYAGASPRDSRLIFEYGAGDGPPAFSIQESPVETGSRVQLRLREGQELGAERQVASGPGAATRPGLPAIRSGGPGAGMAPGPDCGPWRRSGATVATTRERLIQPIAWTVRGTRIMPPTAR